MNEHEGIPGRFLQTLRRARDGLTVGDEVGLALRAHRRALGLSQREYAAARGLSRPRLARLEAGAGRMHLEAVTEALEGTGFALAVTRCAPDAPPEGDAGGARAEVPARLAVVDASIRRPISPADWEPTDLVARVRGGRRRFPAHRSVQAVDSPPLWWWMHEFFEGPSEKPQWYAPTPLPSWVQDVAEQTDRDCPTTDAPVLTTDVDDAEAGAA